jgi:hypothetical protein
MEVGNTIIHNSKIFKNFQNELFTMYSLRPKNKCRYGIYSGQTFSSLTRFVENISNICISN